MKQCIFLLIRYANQFRAGECTVKQPEGAAIFQDRDPSAGDAHLMSTGLDDLQQPAGHISILSVSPAPHTC